MAPAVIDCEATNSNMALLAGSGSGLKYISS
ncbi:hypothetical protein FHT22_003208 [Pedobacter sp. SG918]|nr:hypothetical protein [Pedobacter sp. SG918]